MRDSFIYHLTICDGRGIAHEIQADDLAGALGIFTLAHERGLAAWLRDVEQDSLIGCSTVGCFACPHEHKCGDSLDVGSPEAARDFIGRLLNTSGVG